MREKERNTPRAGSYAATSQMWRQQESRTHRMKGKKLKGQTDEEKQVKL